MGSSAFERELCVLWVWYFRMLWCCESRESDVTSALDALAPGELGGTPALKGRRKSGCANVQADGVEPFPVATLHTDV